MMRRKNWCVFLGLVLLSPSLSFAYNFKLTEAEFRTWPAYCKVVYVVTTVGSRTTLSGLISQSEFVAGKAVLASQPPYGEGGLHHLCAGMKWLDRARIESDPQRKGSYLSRAINESQYTFDRVTDGSFVFILASTQMAAALHENGETSKALELLESAIMTSPGNPAPYILKAQIHHKQREFGLARDVLDAGNRNVASESLEIHYNLGLVLVKLGEYDAAAEHAYLAYEGGYPLSGLRFQLERMGHWDPPQ